METSNKLEQLPKALLEFHKEVGKIYKSDANPFFKSKYASLATILDVISDPLTKNGLMVIQFPTGLYQLTTRLQHISGEFMESTYEMQPVKHSPQDAGSVITYQRRYAIGAILNLNIDEDDDGNKGSGATPIKPRQEAPNKTKLLLGSDAFKKCREAYLKDNKHLAGIKEKYDVVEEVEKALTNPFKDEKDI
jgi:hypothetical protein